MITVNGAVAVPGPRRAVAGPARAPADPAPPRPPLIGRDHETAAITAALDRALTGAAQLVEVTGDPGLGKSALLAEAASLARQRGVPVAPAWAPGTGGPGALAAALGDRLAAADPGLRREHSRAVAALGLAGGVADPPDRPFTAERALVRGLCAPDGLVVLLDDLHHGDDHTIALIADLLARPLRAPLLVAYAYRDRQAPLALRVAAQRGRHATRLPLGPLTEPQCAALADQLTAAPSSRTRSRALHRDSHGVPLYVRALAGGDRRRSAVHAALLADLDGLSPGARRALSAAAVLGGELEPGIVAAVADLPESTRYPVFDELCRHDLLRAIPGTGRFGFRHQLLCEAVYQSTEPGWRLAAHGSAAQLLAARHAPAQVLAPHLVQVAVPGNADAAAVLTEAAVSVRGRAPETAVQWLDTAVRLLPDTEDGQDNRADLLLERALTLATAGRGAAAREAVHAAIAVLRPHLAARRLRAITFCSRLERQLAHRDEGPALLRRELESLGAAQNANGAALMAELAGNELVDGRLAEARTWAAQSLPAARRHGARHVEAAGHGVLAMSYCLAGDVPRAAAALAQAATLLDGLLDGELAAQREAATWIGWTEIMLGRPWDALRHLDRALSGAQPAGPQLGVAHLMVARIVALTAVGRLADAATDAEELADLAAAADAQTLRTVAGAAATWVELWTGGEHGRRGTARNRTGGDPAGSDSLGWFGVVARGMRAETLLGHGDPAGCAELLLAEGPRLPAADAWSRVRWCELLTRAALAEGRTGAAREWAARAAVAAAPLALPGLNGVALLARAQVQAVAEPAVAAATATVAAEEFTSGGMLTDARRATVVAATARAACGEIDAARHDLALVQEAFEQGGALRLARETAKLRTRVASRARPISGPAATDVLTARERQVAALVAEGASNREIARALEVKEKTVEMHVSRVFVKLNVVNRVGVARAFRDRAGTP